METDSEEESKRQRWARSARQIGILTTIPFMMVACPLAGGWLGYWADSKLGSGSLLAALGALLGLIAGLRQTILLIRQASEENHKD